jgi:1,4-alpha-glucan branching enzyme
LYEHLGAHAATADGARGVRFAVWAPFAQAVSVIGDFNGWNRRANPMKKAPGSGVWVTFVGGLGDGALYRYDVETAGGDWVVHSDPFGFRMETPPKSASVVWDLGGYSWQDAEWIARRADRPVTGAPMSIYEVHLGSWRRRSGEGNRFLTYRELAEELPNYVAEMGFTHVELMPVAEHPFYGSWGYQQTGYYAPTSRYGAPQDFMALVDAFHRRGIAVILDWVPAHFPTDGYALARFDGTALYEHLDPRRGFHQDWKTYIFNHGRNEVSNFLLANALFWIEKFHVDGLRVDAVSSMLYLDYSRKEGEWLPNEYGGRENLEAIEFLRHINSVVAEEHPGVAMIAEESTAFAGVTRPTHLGGLGFTHKWNLGWMHDWLDFFSKDPLARKYHTGRITFSMWYTYAEQYILILGHDEVVHMKGSLLNKMPGEKPQKAANLRALFAMMYAHPGRKLVFMGSELAPWSEWNHDAQLDWHLLADPVHAGMRSLVKDLNHLYRGRAELHALDDDARGFEWVDFNDFEQTTFSWLRFAPDRASGSLLVANLTPVARHGYRIGVPYAGRYRELLNTNAQEYGGSGEGNMGGVDSEAVGSHGRPHSIAVMLPPLAVTLFEVPVPPREGAASAGAMEGAGAPAVPVRRPRVAKPKPAPERERRRRGRAPARANPKKKNSPAGRKRKRAK